MHKLFAAFLLPAIFFIVAGNVFGGGGPIEIETYSNGDFTQSHQYTVRVHVNPITGCNNVPVTFRFKDTKPGDYVSTESPTIAHSITVTTNGKTYEDCTTYAKVASGVAEGRLFIVDVQTNSQGLVGNEFMLSFNAPTGSYDPNFTPYWTKDWYLNSIKITPIVTDTPKPTPPSLGSASLKVVYPAYGSFTPGQATAITWIFNATPDIYTPYPLKTTIELNRMIDDSAGVRSAVIADSMPLTLLSGEKNLLNWTVPAVDPGKYKIFIKVEGMSHKSNGEPFVLSNLSADTFTITQANGTPGQDQNVNELQKKVSNLQNQFSESQKKQIMLEQVVNNLVAFIRSLFPFFK